MIHYVFIHGANSSTNSFNYIISQLELSEKDYTRIDYSSIDGFYENLSKMEEKLGKKKKLFIIGHSLGGLYAIHLSQKVDCMGGMCIATPHNGSSLADWMRFMNPKSKLLQDVGTMGLPVLEAKQIVLDMPWIHVVTTRGRVPWMIPDNDGVITIRSQKSRNDVNYVELPYNHFEVMCVPETVTIIGDFQKMLSKG